MCSTIASLADGRNTFRTRLGAASWIRSFVFSHGSQSQHTALSEGIVPALVECLEDSEPRVREKSNDGWYVSRPKPTQPRAPPGPDARWAWDDRIPGRAQP